MNRNFFLILLVLFIVGCNSSNDTFLVEGGEISGKLDDVSNGQYVLSLFDSDVVSGLAELNFNGSYYQLIAATTNLEDPPDSYFYEGWLVRRGVNFDVISTGKAEKKGPGFYTNVFYSDLDLADHDFYVLTIEPDDGDPAPADHVLEGTMS